MMTILAPPSLPEEWDNAIDSDANFWFHEGHIVELTQTEAEKRKRLLEERRQFWPTQAPCLLSVEQPR